MQEHKMRRKDRLLTPEQTEKLLAECEYGTLATVDAEGWPYAVPLSYAFFNGRVYFHSALEGHKIENGKNSAKCSFCAVGKTQPLFKAGFTTYYESAIVFGTLRLVEDADEKNQALYQMCMKYLPGDSDKIQDSIEHAGNRTLVYAIDPSRITGKANAKKA